MGGRAKAAAMAGKIHDMDLQGLAAFVAHEKQAKEFLIAFGKAVEEHRRLIQADADLNQIKTMLATAKTERQDAAAELAQAKAAAKQDRRHALELVDEARAEAQNIRELMEQEKGVSDRAISKAKHQAVIAEKKIKSDRESAAEEKAVARKTREKAMEFKNQILAKKASVEELLAALQV